jgi:hypothetical protein
LRGREYGKTEEKIFEQKLRKVTKGRKGRESQEADLGEVGRPYAQCVGQVGQLQTCKKAYEIRNLANLANFCRCSGGPRRLDRTLQKQTTARMEPCPLDDKAIWMISNVVAWASARARFCGARAEAHATKVANLAAESPF